MNRCRPDRSRLATATMVALLAGVLAPGCSTPPEGPGVLLVTLDTTRPDRIGAYGHPDAHTPHLDALARSGTLFELGIADVPVTLPSHTTLMTGIPALGHGVRYNADFKVAESAVTLAEKLRDAGYATGAVISALVLDSKFGIAQGFDHYDDDLTPGYVKHDESLYPDQTHWLPKADRRAAEAVDRSIAWLTGAPRPFFLWTHIYDPHFPFDPPPPWSARTADLYLAEIEYTDHQLGRLMKRLAASALSEETVIVVTADHGEGLDQHREDGHGIFLYDDTIRVPLVIHAPGADCAGRVIPDQVRTMDVAATVLELAGAAEPSLGLGGSLVPLMRGIGPAPDSVAYCESIKTKLFYGGSGLKAIRTRNAKFVWAPRPELYDLARDPGETRSLPDDADRMRRFLATQVAAILSAGEATVEAANPDAETLEALASLGYLGGSGGTARPGTTEEEMHLTGYDPKDLVDVSMAAREIQNGFFDSGERKLRRFFRTAPTPRDDRQMTRLWAAAHQNYAKIWMVRKDYAAAAKEYRLACETDPTYDAARWSLIFALNLARDEEAAVREGGRILEEWPRSWRVRFHRGIALAEMGNTDEATAELDRILRDAPQSHDARKLAAYYRPRLGTPSEAEALAAYRQGG